MRPFVSLCRQGCLFGLKSAVRFLLWGLWLFLATCLCLQLWMVLSNGIHLPAPALRFLERRLSTTETSLHLGRVSFTPGGELLLCDFALTLNAYDEPFLRGATLTTRLDPWGVLFGERKFHTLEITGIELLVPSALSPSGHNEAFVSNLDLQASAEGRLLTLSTCHGSVAGLSLNASGTIDLSPLLNRQAKDSPGFTLEEAVRQLALAAKLARQVPPLEEASLDVSLHPSSTQLALADLQFHARSLQLEKPFALSTGPLELSTRLPLRGNEASAVSLDLIAAQVSLPRATLRDLRLRLDASLIPDSLALIPLLLQGQVSGLVADSVPVDGVAFRLSPPSGGFRFSQPEVFADLQAGTLGSLVSLSGLLGTAPEPRALRVRARVKPGLMELASARAGRNLLRFCTPYSTVLLDGNVSLNPNYRPVYAEAWVHSGPVSIYGVHTDFADGRVIWDGTQFSASDTFVRMGPNQACGSYWMNFPSLDFRFLLKGAARPMALKGWFKEWWVHFWEEFDFPGPIPAADVDVQGRWKFIPQTHVFIGVDAEKAVIRSLSLDRADARLFLRPHYVHALSFHATRPEGSARGWFQRSYSASAASWNRIRFDVTSTMDPVQAALLLPSHAPALLAPFSFSTPPTIHASGYLDGPGAPAGPARKVDAEIASSGRFQIQNFPLEEVSCKAHWEGSQLQLEDISALYSGGRVKGRARIQTEGPGKAIDFTGTLENARLGDAVAQIEAFVARHRPSNTPSTKETTLERLKNIAISLEATASGTYNDVTSFTGSGAAYITGPELTRVRLLGGLSRLLSFTSLRFGNAKAEFLLEKDTLRFPSVRIYGSSSAITGRGSLNLKAATLDFTAKVFPFGENPNLLQGAFGLVLSPLSHVLEVKLSGNLNSPDWSFVHNPFHVVDPVARPTPLAPPHTAAERPPDTPKPLLAPSPDDDTP